MVEGATRPCQAGTTATRAPLSSPSTTTSRRWRRKATSSSNVCWALTTAGRGRGRAGLVGGRGRGAGNQLGRGPPPPGSARQQRLHVAALGHRGLRAEARDGERRRGVGEWDRVVHPAALGQGDRKGGGEGKRA